ncbi:Leu/Phe/Val dehydrogenase [Oceanicella actignis]|uniref:Leucine dehydrogenase n=1 Tax=Oceanicella actignis TaxID=1189325 RepID=A0A1M7RWK8_9RHOB|nr:Glu/Leu/Phe/Val dehydrogenase dimerization domain-containing protein [Oceanicella actignis]SET00060.1 leucine dehydrogenase [Oceanicella actignis]SHN50518.1 leucine dehydrogenase [Oceanicella actignis]
MTPFDHPEFDDHEQVIFVRDAEVGLFGIIALHDTTLGPAAGGCRMQPYASHEEALRDVLRLSRGMTLKNAAAGLPLGGGKCVIVADPARADKARLLEAMGRHVQALGGRYWTAIDVGVSPRDADAIARSCDYVFCKASEYPDGFDPSNFTAWGGFVAVKAVLRRLFGDESPAGRRIAVQGLGGVGRELCRLLREAGADLVVADIDQAALRRVVEELGAEPVDPARIHAAPADVFAPCALGGVLNDRTIPELGARAVCGLANNQLEAPRHAQALQARGVLYAPDFIANAGGVIGASAPIWGGPDRAAAMRRIEGIGPTLDAIFARAEAEGLTTDEVAQRMAAERLAAARAARPAA